ncbi:unnamed protein product [Caenorhabditis auriculariae]|uniref:Ion transport domain-containing protein n=1 Tax=Caenorhabditis auriculariae TaxID=2777116 RepID=A0A8S1HIT8_9PELO|nr:unnamed protein product [Caenorhabditis auriculariae]
MGSGSSSAATANQNIGMGKLREDRKLYRLVDMHGGGELLPWLRYALISNDHSFIDAYIDTKVREFLYNGGKGKLVTVTELVKLRNKPGKAQVRTSFLSKMRPGPPGLMLKSANVREALKLLDGGGKGGRGESKYRELAWKLEERGSMGETIVGICLLQATEIHNRLVLKVLEAHPKLVNDIHISEDFYGLTPLHQAIINQDCKMVYTLLRLGADVNSRCYGAFFCADDQKTSRTDSLEHEYVDLSLKTNYSGNMYFGEYPLSFAVCLNQPDCFRLLLAFKASPNAQDTNGNTVLHLCVIHENMKMFKLALDSGASLRMVNKQSLTPLTLAAKLAKKQMFQEILELEGDSVWAYGDASSTAYPLAKIDTINETSGEMNDASALSLVVYGQTVAHLELLDGLLDTVLEAKWEAFARRNMIMSMAAFSTYYICLVCAFMLRPVGWSTEISTEGWVNRYEATFTGQYSLDKDSVTVNTSADGIQLWKPELAQCHLRNYWDKNMEIPNSYVRLGFEAMVLIGIIGQIFLDARDVKRIGRKKWFDVLKAFPAKLAYKLTYILVLAVVPIRLLCNVSPVLLILDNTLATITIILTTTHYLYYFRVIRFVGPFVLMVYTIIATDIFRFLLIYGIFLMGFSQAFSLIFLSCEREATNITKTMAQDPNHPYLKGMDVVVIKNAEGFVNVIQNPAEAFVRTFILTIGEFTVLYRNLALCPSDTMVWIGKIVFILFELFVSIMQFNLLIAMMTRTYETIFRTQQEYKRQRAQVILMLELSLSPEERLQYLLKYSRPTGTNKKTRSLVVNKKAPFYTGTSEEQLAKEEKARKIVEERKAVWKRKLKDLEVKEGIRPTTGFARTPRPHTQYLRSKDS